MTLLVNIPNGSMARSTSVSFASLMGMGCDRIVKGIVLAVNATIEQEDWSPATANTVCSSARLDFIPWLAAASVALGRPLTFKDIDHDLLESYAEDLKLRKKYSTAAQSFDQIISLLHATARLRLSPPVALIKPHNLFPDRAASQKPTRPFSKTERNKLIIALTKDLEEVRRGTHEVVAEADGVVIYYKLIEMRTGFNASSLLALGRDALRDHPLRPGYKILVSFKPRGMRQVDAPTKWSDEVDDFRICGGEIAQLYHELLRFTADLSAQVPEEDRAFIRPPLRPQNKPAASRTGLLKPTPLTASDVSNAIHQRISPRHGLLSDDGTPLRPEGRRFRATLAARAFELSDGDPFVVARVLNNTPRVANTHYATAPPESLPEFFEAMTQLATRLRRPLAPGTPVHRTPNGGCSDPLNGKYAPKDGVTYCERWLHCFKCPHQCITGEDDDLWRLYSFYWALQRNGQRIRRLPIGGLFRFVIKAMETIVIDRFGERARIAMARARQQPHPFWALAIEGNWLHV